MVVPRASAVPLQLSAALAKLQEQCDEKDAQLAFILGEDVNMKLKECTEKEAQLARALQETEELKRRRERVAAASAKVHRCGRFGQRVAREKNFVNECTSLLVNLCTKGYMCF